MEGCWFQFPALPAACWSVIEPDTEPQIAPDKQVGTLHGILCHHCMNVCEKGLNKHKSI